MFLIGSQPVSPPARACPDLPPASHSGLGAGGLAGRQADRSPAPLCSLQRASLLCLELPQLDCLKLLMQHLRNTGSQLQCFFLDFVRQQDFIFATLGQNKNLTSVVPWFHHCEPQNNCRCSTKKLKSLQCLSLRDLPDELCSVKLFCVVTFLKPSECSSGT